MPRSPIVSEKNFIDFKGSWIVHSSSKELLELVRYQPNKELVSLTREY